MKTSKITHSLLIAIIVASFFVGGCANYARKPPQPDPYTPGTRTDTSSAAITLDPNTTMEITNQAVGQAQKIAGVSAATAIVSDKVILVGLDLDGNVGMNSTAIEKNVMEQVKSIHPDYVVSVTSEPSNVTAIKTVAEGIAQGKTVLNYKKEMDMLMIKLSPQ